MARKSKEPNEVRRALGILRLMEGTPVAAVARSLEAARSTVYAWAARFNSGGVAGLRMAVQGAPPRTVTHEFIEAVTELLGCTPQSLGYLRSTWSTELLAFVLEEKYGFSAHSSTVRRLLPKLGYGWRRARRKSPRS